MIMTNALLNEKVLENFEEASFGFKWLLEPRL